MYVFMHVSMNVCMCVCMYDVYMYVFCMYVYKNSTASLYGKTCDVSAADRPDCTSHDGRHQFACRLVVPQCKSLNF